MKKKVFLDAFCRCNLGDDLFIEIICKRYPQVEFYLMLDKDVMNGLKDIPNLHIIQRGKIVKAIDKIGRMTVKRLIMGELLSRGNDAAVLIGGSMFIEAESQIWKARLKNLEKMQKNAGHFFVLGANFGAYQSEEFRKAYQDFFETCDDVCFREQWTLQQFDPKENLRYAPDIVFGTGNCDTEDVLTEKRISVIPIRMEIRDSLAGYAQIYKEKMAEVIQESLAEGYAVSLITFCRRQGDEIAAEEILDLLPQDKKNQVDYLKYDGNIKTVLQEIAKSEHVITTRFHGMILSWIYGVSVCPIVYDYKMTHVIEECGFSGNVVPVEKIGEYSAKSLLAKAPQMDVREQERDAAGHFAGLDLLLQGNNG